MNNQLPSELTAEVFNHSSEAIMLSDQDGKVISVNAMFTEITGYVQEEVIGKLFCQYLSHETEFINDLKRSLEETGIWEGQIWSNRKDQTLYPKQLRVYSVKSDDSFYISYFRDISRLKRCEKELESIASFDVVTGLANRYLFQDRFTQALSLAKRKNLQMALFLLDLNRFKSINESFGYKFGDLLLKEVADRLIENTRNSDNVAHMGGDEFALILNDVASTNGSVKVAEKIIKAMSEPFRINGEEIFVSCSVGASVFPFDGEDHETLLKKADAALIQAKRKENENFQFYSEGMFEALNERLKIEIKLNKALLNGEFEVFYQPKVNLHTNKIVAMESLIRWIHPEDGLIFPDKFIPVAEDTDMIIPIGEWVLKQSCLQTKLWHNMGYKNLKVAVNLSMNQMNQQNLVCTVKDILNETGLEPYCLELELTESIFSSRLEETIQMLEELKGLGIQMSIDDFGTGYSSLSYIKRFPIDTIKIDRSFMIGVPKDIDNAAISSTIIAMAKNLNLSMVAEGIEDVDQIEFLKSHGCEIGQGYFYSKPVPAPKFEELLKKYNTK